MTILKGKRGAWINQYAQPSASIFRQRASQVHYVIIKYGLPFYEALAVSIGRDWLAEIMCEDGPGDQGAYLRPDKYAEKLAAQASKPGCIGAVVNMEEADGGWHLDSGAGASQFFTRFKQLSSKPIFASLDTRGNRPNYAYQLVCSQAADGVMPMMYPTAFDQSVPNAYKSVLTELVKQRWQGKEIHMTLQTYGAIGVADVATECGLTGILLAGKVVHGLNAYTLGHANEGQWIEYISKTGWAQGDLPQPPPPTTLAQALVALHRAWHDQWCAIADKGTIDEAVALADYWYKLVH